MLLAHRLWEEVPRGAAATLGLWEAAHEAALAELDAEFDARWRGFDLAEQKTLRALIAGDGSPYKERVLQRLALSKATALSCVCTTRSIARRPAACASRSRGSARRWSI